MFGQYSNQNRSVAPSPTETTSGESSASSSATHENPSVSQRSYTGSFVRANSAMFDFLKLEEEKTEIFVFHYNPKGSSETDEKDIRLKIAMMKLRAIKAATVYLSDSGGKITYATLEGYCKLLKKIFDEDENKIAVVRLVLEKKIKCSDVVMDLFITSALKKLIVHQISTDLLSRLEGYYLKHRATLSFQFDYFKSARDEKRDEGFFAIIERLKSNDVVCKEKRSVESAKYPRALSPHAFHPYRRPKEGAKATSDKPTKILSAPTKATLMSQIPIPATVINPTPCILPNPYIANNYLFPFSQSMNNPFTLSEWESEAFIWPALSATSLK